MKCSICLHHSSFTVKLNQTSKICEGCLQLSQEILYEEKIAFEHSLAFEEIEDCKKRFSRSKILSTIYCSRCNKSYCEVARMIKMPDDYALCNHCVGELLDVLNDYLRSKDTKNVISKQPENAKIED